MKCPTCGTEFEHRNNRQIFCNPGCSKLNRHKQTLQAKQAAAQRASEKELLEEFGVSTHQEFKQKESIEITDWEVVSQAIEKADSRWCESLEHISTPIRNVVEMNNNGGRKDATM